MRIERVVWLDSLSINDGNWMPIDDVRDPDTIVAAELRQEAVGYVVAESPDVLALAGHRNAADSDANRDTRVGHVLLIPICAIVARRVLVDASADVQIDAQR